MLGVTVAGPFSEASEAGESARLCADALARLGWCVTWLDLAQHHAALDRCPAQGPVLIYAAPPLFGEAVQRIGSCHLRGRDLIGCWVWDLEEAPYAWRDAAHCLREVWTPSLFSARALRAALPVPVHVVPYPVGPRRAMVDRPGFGLPAAACIFLAFADLRFDPCRDNPEATMAAYARAFPTPQSEVLLVLKLTGAMAAPEQVIALRAAALRCACRVRFIIDTLDSAQTDRLIASCDVVVSLHRSTGSGLTLAKALALGRPVVATAWSGNLDFMTRERAALVETYLTPTRNAQGSVSCWAEPDVAEAADWLRRLAASPALRACLVAETATIDLPKRFEAALRHTALRAGPGDCARDSVDPSGLVPKPC